MGKASRASRSKANRGHWCVEYKLNPQSTKPTVELFDITCLSDRVVKAGNKYMQSRGQLASPVMVELYNNVKGNRALIWDGLAKNIYLEIARGFLAGDALTFVIATNPELRDRLAALEAWAQACPETAKMLKRSIRNIECERRLWSRMGQVEQSTRIFNSVEEFDGLD